MEILPVIIEPRHIRCILYRLVVGLRIKQNSNTPFCLKPILANSSYTNFHELCYAFRIMSFQLHFYDLRFSGR